MFPRTDLTHPHRRECQKIDWKRELEGGGGWGGLALTRGLLPIRSQAVLYRMHVSLRSDRASYGCKRLGRSIFASRHQ